MGSKRIFGHSKDWWKQALTGYVLILPSILALGIFYIYPIIYTLYLSITDWNLLAPVKRVIGFGNYTWVLSQPLFRQSCANTFYFTLAVVVFSMAIGLCIAILTNDKSRFSAAVQGSLFSTYVVSWVAMALLWIWLLDRDFGLVNMGLKAIGLKPVNWLGSPDVALKSLTFVSVWKQVGYTVVFFLAGLQDIPLEYHEAAMIDGASTWQRFWNITWPLLSPTTFFLFSTMIIGISQTFDIVKIMTGGGPVGSTTTFVYYVYQRAFEFFDIGGASAAAVVFLAVLIFLTACQLYASKKMVHYDRY